jgi:hypothetical protein
MVVYETGMGHMTLGQGDGVISAKLKDIGAAAGAWFREKGLVLILVGATLGALGSKFGEDNPFRLVTVTSGGVLMALGLFPYIVELF